jgi:hypothetical protein
MTLKFGAATRFALLLAAGAVAGLVAGVSAANAEQTKRRVMDARYSYGAGGPNVSYQHGPRTRIYVSRRSWLDGGTEVLPGDRKFLDYAFPSPYGFPSFAVQNVNRPIERQPLNEPVDLGGAPTKFPLY